VLSGRILCVGLITLLEAPYRVSCVVVSDRGASKIRRPWPTRGCYAIQNERVSVFLSSPARAAHAPYYTVICGLSGPTIFFHMSLKRHNFRITFTEHKVCFEFPLQLLLKIFLILITNQRHTIINVQVPRSSCKVPVFLCKVPVYLAILIKPEFSQRIFGKSSNFTKIRAMEAQ
jgi:hypothetical protein